MMLKGLNIAMVLCMLMLTTKAQQLSVYNADRVNPLIYNPSYLSSQSHTNNFYLTNAKYWLSVEGAPISFNFIYANKNQSKLSYGGMVNMDHAGAFRTFNIGGMVAYSTQLAEYSFLNFGLQGGFTSLSLDYTKVDAFDPTDQVLDFNQQSRGNADMTFGINLKIKQFDLGASVPHVLENPIAYRNIGDQLQIGFKRQFNGQMSYAIDSVGPATLSPYVQYRYLPGVIGQYQGGFNALIKEKLMLNLGYKEGQVLVFGFGLKMGEKTQFYYSAEIAGNSLNYASQGSHEIMLSYHINGVGESSPIIQEDMIVLDLKADSLIAKVDSMDMKLRKVCECEDFEVWVEYLGERIDSLKPEEQMKRKAQLAMAKNALVNGKPINEENGEDPKYNMDLDELDVGHVFQVNDVYFETDSYVLDINSQEILDLFVEFLLLNPTVTIDISGHTDSRSSDIHNLILSKNRARAVYLYFLMNGIEASRMTHDGYGESRPIMTNDTEEGRAMNRRTEIMITSK